MDDAHLGTDLPQELDRLRSGLRLMALRALGNLDAAEEAAQEALTRALGALRQERLRDPERLGAFVRGIAHHVIVDFQRASSRHVRLDELEGTTALATHENPLARIVSAEEATQVRAALDRLSSTDRELLRLCYYDGLAPGELAARLGEPAERVRKRKSRALERLRAAFLGRSGHDPHPATTVIDDSDDAASASKGRGK